MKKHILIAALLLAAVTGFSNIAPAQQPAPQSTEVQLTPDLELVTASIAHELWQKPESERAVIFDPAGRHQLREPGFAYPGFIVARIDYSDYGLLQEDRTAIMARGAMQFQDEYQRAASVAFMAKYRVSDDGEITILDSLAEPYSPPNPRVGVIFVDRETVKNAGQGIYDSWEKLFTFAVNNAVGRGETSKRPNYYYVFVFCLDRIAPDAKLDVIASRKQDEKRPTKSIADTDYLDYQGYRVGVAGGKMTLESSKNVFYINIYYTPGSDVPQDKRAKKLVGQFGNK